MRPPHGSTTGARSAPVDPSFGGDPGTGPGEHLGRGRLAILFWEKHGFRLVTPETKDRLLRTYWSILSRRIETSVVLADPTWLTLADYNE